MACMQELRAVAVSAHAPTLTRSPREDQHASMAANSAAHGVLPATRRERTYTLSKLNPAIAGARTGRGWGEGAAAAAAAVEGVEGVEGEGRRGGRRQAG